MLASLHPLPLHLLKLVEENMKYLSGFTASPGGHIDFPLGFPGEAAQLVHVSPSEMLVT